MFELDFFVVDATRQIHGAINREHLFTRKPGPLASVAFFTLTALLGSARWFDRDCGASLRGRRSRDSLRDDRRRGRRFLSGWRFDRRYWSGAGRGCLILSSRCRRVSNPDLALGHEF